MKKLLLRILPFCLLASPACFAQDSAQSAGPSNTIYAIRYNTNGWKLEISVNGVPLLKRDKGGDQVPIESLIVNGSNKIAINATQLEADAPRLEVEVISVDEKTGNETTMSQYTGAPGKAGTAAGKTIEVQCAVPMQWAWEKAQDVKTLTAADQDEIFKQVKKLADSLNGHDLKTHDQLRAVFLNQTSQFEGMSRDRVQIMSDDIYDQVFQNETSQWLSRDRDQLNIQSYGRITVVSAKQPWPDNWTIMVKLPKQQNYSFHDLLFAKIGGKWVLIN